VSPPTSEFTGKSRIFNTSTTSAVDYEQPRPRLYLWSASDECGIQRWVSLFQSYLLNFQGSETEFLDNLAYTLAKKRSNLPWKSFLIAASVEEILEGLSNRLSKAVRSTNNSAHLAFIFTGQGASWYAMGRELMQFSTFSHSLQAAGKYFEGLGCKWSLIGMST